MRTKAEIEERLKQLKTFLEKPISINLDPILYQEGYKILTWALEEPTYKRTIFELTEEEIRTLFYKTGIINDCEDIGEFCISKDSDGIKVCFLTYKTGIEGDCIFLDDEYIIKENFDIYCLIDSFRCYAVPNQAQFIDTIRNMLSMEKPNEN